MILVIDSVTAALSVALIDGDRLIDERHSVVGRGHAEHLIPTIENLLDGRRPDALLVDCGPGSFTGIRVGLAAAAGLAIGWRIPLTGYSSTAIVAAGARDRARMIGVALHGGHGELFVQSFNSNPLAAIDALQSLPPAGAAAALSAALVVGSAAEALVAERGSGEALDRLPRASDARFLPDALRSLPPRPIYGRAPDAKAAA
jgi:tRNA threonylcarbamoyladenosine biosynthesis protein TsaB